MEKHFSTDYLPAVTPFTTECTQYQNYMHKKLISGHEEKLRLRIDLGDSATHDHRSMRNRNFTIQRRKAREVALF
jgi:hypothetical protein